MAVFGFVFFANLAYAEDTTIEMLNKRDDGAKMVYSEDIARIDVGDTITWVPTSKGHNVEFVAGPEGWDLPKKSKNNKTTVIPDFRSDVGTEKSQESYEIVHGFKILFLSYCARAEQAFTFFH